MLYQLPAPIPANYAYDALRIENMRYDGAQFIAEVFGVVGGQVVPFIFGTSTGLQRVSECTITDAEIDTCLAAHPEITARLDAGMRCAMERLYALAGTGG